MDLEKSKIKANNRERQARSRSLKSDDEIEKIRARDRVMKSGKRSLMTEEEKAEIRAKDRARKARSKLLKTKDEEDATRAKDKDYAALRRSLMTEEEKAKIRGKDRERKARNRSLNTEEERQNIRASNKERMARSRSLMTEDQKDDMNYKDRKRKSNVNNAESTKQYYVENEREFNRLYKVKIRGNRSDEEIEFDRIELLLRMRKHRQSRNGKEHLLDKLQAMRGMRLFREDGRLVQFSERFSYCKFKRNGLDLEEFLWNQYYNEGPKSREVLKRKRPDVYNTIVERKEKERKLQEERDRKEKELDDAGRWNYDHTNDTYYWSITGESEFEYMAKHGKDVFKEDYSSAWDRAWTEEDDRRWQDQLEEWSRQEMEQMKKERKEQLEEKRLERNRLAKEKRQEVQQKLKEPIAIETEYEISEYERIREQNIKEIKDAMKDSGWFSD